MYFPKKIKSNTIVRQVISNIDFTPTLLDMMDIPYKKKYFDGCSAAALLKGQSDSGWQNTAILSMPGQIAVITDRFKLILGRKNEPILIDLINDPEELNNEIDKIENRDTIRLLALNLKTYLEKNNDPNWNNSLTSLYDRRVIQHKKYREPGRQNASRNEVSWKEELSAQVNNLIR